MIGEEIKPRILSRSFLAVNFSSRCILHSISCPGPLVSPERFIADPFDVSAKRDIVDAQASSYSDKSQIV